MNDNEFVYVAIVLDVILYAGLDREAAFREIGEVGNVHVWSGGMHICRYWVQDGVEYSARISS